MREQHEDEKHLTLVRVVAPHFVAGPETDGTARRAAPILKEQDWKASIVARPSIHQNEESFEVRYAGGRKYFYFDDDASRR